MSGCIHRGRHNDASTKMGYASISTYCYRIEPAIPIKIKHQETYCLCANHVNCPLLNRGRMVLPLEQIQRNTVLPDKQPSLLSIDKPFQWVAVLSVIAVIGLIVAFW